MGEAIVCGVDDSAEATRAVRLAASLSYKLGLELVVAHVVEVHAPASATIETEAELLAPGAALLRRIHDDVGLGATRTVLESGRPAEAIRQAAVRENAQLVVVGSRGRGRAAAAVLGSAARALAADAPCPVVVVPPRASIALGDRGGGAGSALVCGLDASDQAVDAARVGVDLAARLGLTFFLVHALEDAHGTTSGAAPRILEHDYDQRLDLEVRPALRLLERTLEAIGDPPRAQTRIGIGKPAAVIEAVADAEKAGMVAVGSRGRGRVQTGLLGSVSGELAASGGSPVVVVSGGRKPE